MSTITMEEINLLENKVANMERIMGPVNEDVKKDTLKTLDDINNQVDKMLGKHPKTQTLLKRLDELSAYTDPSFIMRYDPSKFIQQEYVVSSSDRLQKAAAQASKISELKNVVNPQNLKNVPEMEKQINPLTLKCLQLHDSGEEQNKEIIELVGKYNSILSTLSEQFVVWDDLLRHVEEDIKSQEK